MDVSGLVTGALLLVLRVSKVFGLAPVTFTRVDNAYRITLSSSVSYYGYALVGILYKKSVHTDTLITLRVLSKAYTASCELIMQYNTTENLTAMVLFVMYTIQLTFTIKNFATGLGASDLKQRAEACSGEVVWLIFHTVRAVSFIEPWYQISREMMTINKELGQVAQSVTSIGEEMPMELNTFCSQTMINKPNLTPFGCFTVTRSQLGELSDDKKNKSRFIIVMFYVGVRSFFLCMGTLLRYQETDSIQRFLMHTFVEAHHLLISLLEIQMICIGYAVQRTLNSIVQELSKLRSHVHRDQRDRAFYSLSSLQTSAKTFTDTCEVMERVNACHGCLVLLFIALYTHHIIFTADSLAYFLTHADIETAKFFGKCSLDVMWLLYHIIRAVIFVHPWHGMTQEVDKIKIELCKILQRTSPDDIEMMWGAKVLYMELMIKKPELKPLGLFTVSRSLLVEIHKKTNVWAERKGVILVLFCIALRLYLFNSIHFFYMKDVTKSIALYLGSISLDIIFLNMALLEMSLILVAFEICKYFVTIKDALIELNKDINSDRKPTNRDTKLLLCKLNKAYTESCEVVMRYNLSDNLTTMLILFIIILQLTFTLKNFTVTLGIADTHERAYASIHEAMWLCYHILRAVMFIEPWNKMSTEVGIIKRQLVDIARSVTPYGEEISPELQTFYLQLTTNYPDLTPMGCFKVTRSQLEEDLHDANKEKNDDYESDEAETFCLECTESYSLSILGEEWVQVMGTHKM
ncbi:unnamed protein product [Leptosia nina]|uniref:Gustatory receptor n=1 Tax=Leptosia nina TaxID=320188 RepID=A0AAV1J2F4_9NEOP